MKLQLGTQGWAKELERCLTKQGSKVLREWQTKVDYQAYPVADQGMITNLGEQNGIRLEQPRLGSPRRKVLEQEQQFKQQIY
jgi:hypothetical protein